MAYDYFQSLRCIRDARNKRSRGNLSKKFFDTLRQENVKLPSFNRNIGLVRPYSLTPDDVYSNSILNEQVHLARDGMVAKSVTGNGNCLFNAVSLALIGKI